MKIKKFNILVIIFVLLIVAFSIIPNVVSADTGGTGSVILHATLNKLKARSDGGVRVGCYGVNYGSFAPKDYLEFIRDFTSSEEALLPTFKIEKYNPSKNKWEVYMDSVVFGNKYNLEPGEYSVDVYHFNISEKDFPGLVVDKRPGSFVGVDDYSYEFKITSGENIKIYIPMSVSAGRIAVDLSKLGRLATVNVSADVVDSNGNFVRSLTQEEKNKIKFKVRKYNSIDMAFRIGLRLGELKGTKIFDWGLGKHDNVETRLDEGYEQLDAYQITDINMPSGFRLYNIESTGDNHLNASFNNIFDPEWRVPQKYVDFWGEEAFNSCAIENPIINVEIHLTDEVSQNTSIHRNDFLLYSDNNGGLSYGKKLLQRYKYYESRMVYTHYRWPGSETFRDNPISVKSAKFGDKTYAFVNAINNIYVYDVTDPSNPVQKQKVSIGDFLQYKTFTEKKSSFFAKLPTFMIKSLKSLTNLFETHNIIKKTTLATSLSSEGLLAVGSQSIDMDVSSILKKMSDDYNREIRRGIMSTLTIGDISVNNNLNLVAVSIVDGFNGHLGHNFGGSVIIVSKFNPSTGEITQLGKNYSIVTTLNRSLAREQIGIYGNSNNTYLFIKTETDLGKERYSIFKIDLDGLSKISDFSSIIESLNISSWPKLTGKPKNYFYHLSKPIFFRNINGKPTVAISGWNNNDGIYEINLFDISDPNNIIKTNVIKVDDMDSSDFVDIQQIIPDLGSGRIYLVIINKKSVRSPIYNKYLEVVDLNNGSVTNFGRNSIDVLNNIGWNNDSKLVQDYYKFLGLDKTQFSVPNTTVDHYLPFTVLGADKNIVSLRVYTGYEGTREPFSDYFGGYKGVVDLILDVGNVNNPKILGFITMRSIVAGYSSVDDFHYTDFTSYKNITRIGDVLYRATGANLDIWGINGTAFTSSEDTGGNNGSGSGGGGIGDGNGNFFQSIFSLENLTKFFKKIISF